MAPPTIRADTLNQTVNNVDPRFFGHTIAWTDNARGVSGGVMSCLGKNITDQKLDAEDGNLPMIRSDNYNELLGVTDAEKIHCGKGLTLKDIYDDLEKYIVYMGYKSCKRPQELKKMVVRFQTAFVGIQSGETRNICPANFSYQTCDEQDPRNLLLVVTPTGIYAHTDGVGYKRLSCHVINDDGTVMSKWFECEESEFAAGSAQEESVGQKRPPPGERRATVAKLGVEGTGDRCNRMLIISIPLKQKQKEYSMTDEMCVYRSLGASTEVGKCRAARLNVGDDMGKASVVDGLDLEVDDSEQIMCTQMDWNVLVSKGSNEVTISDGDAELVTRDMIKAYEACDCYCTLSELSPMLHKMEKEHMEKIETTFKAVREMHAAKASKKDPYMPDPDALKAFA